MKSDKKRLKDLEERIEWLENEVLSVRKMAKRTENKVYHSKFEPETTNASIDSPQIAALNKVWGK